MAAEIETKFILKWLNDIKDIVKVQALYYDVLLLVLLNVKINGFTSQLTGINVVVYVCVCNLSLDVLADGVLWFNRFVRLNSFQLIDLMNPIYANRSVKRTNFQEIDTLTHSFIHSHNVNVIYIFINNHNSVAWNCRLNNDQFFMWPLFFFIDGFTTSWRIIIVRLFYVLLFRKCSDHHACACAAVQCMCVCVCMHINDARWQNS